MTLAEKDLPKIMKDMLVLRTQRSVKSNLESGIFFAPSRSLSEDRELVAIACIHHDARTSGKVLSSLLTRVDVTEIPWIWKLASDIAAGERICGGLCSLADIYPFFVKHLFDKSFSCETYSDDHGSSGLEQ
jgi:hypothetical protein